MSEKRKITTIVNEYEKKMVTNGNYAHEKLLKVSRKLFIDDVLQSQDVQQMNEKCVITPEIQKYSKSFLFEKS